MDTGANYTLGSNKHLVHKTDKLNSRLSCRAAFGSDLVRGEKCGILLTWVLKSKDGRLSVQNNAEYKEVQVNLIQNMAFTPQRMGTNSSKTCMCNAGRSEHDFIKFYEG